jgi:hypothetical protein
MALRRRQPRALPVIPTGRATTGRIETIAHSLALEAQLPMKSTSFPSPRHRRLTLVERRNLKMASSAHAYVRGSTVQFYRWLQERGERAVPNGPPVWICGDCDAGNLGRSPMLRAVSMSKSVISTRPLSVTQITI